MSYRLGVDVGGTFTDLLLINEGDSSFHIAKVPSTPADPSIGVLRGTDRVCELAGIDAGEIDHVMHGSTIATNAILTGQGARVGLVTTQGYRHILQIARSYVPGGLGAWVIFNKTPPLAPLKLTVEARERIGAKGEIVEPLDEDALRESLRHLKRQGIDALTISLFNSYTNDVHERAAGFSDGTRVLSTYANADVYFLTGNSTITAVTTSHFWPSGLYYDFNVFWGGSFNESGGDHYISLITSDASKDANVHISERI